MAKTMKQMLEAAEAAIERIPPADAIALQGRDDVVFVDIRDPREIEREGTIPGAFRCTRGMLEFWIDKDSPYHKPIFDPAKTFVFFCAMGWRSSLSTQTAREMGLEHAVDIKGGLNAWKEAGGAIETVVKKP